MKLTKKSVTRQIETTEIVCEIAQEEFDKLCAETAASVVSDMIDGNIFDIIPAIEMTEVLAKFVARLDMKLFNAEETDNKEEK